MKVNRREKHSEAMQTLRAGCSKADPHTNKHTDKCDYNTLHRLACSVKMKISPVGDWRSTSLEWPWPWPWFRPYGITSCITHRPLPTYQISLRLEEKFFWSHHWGFGQVHSHVTQKLGQISKIRPDQM